MTKTKHKPHQWIDGDTADRITSINLKEYRAHLKKLMDKNLSIENTDVE